MPPRVPQFPFVRVLRLSWRIPLVALFALTQVAVGQESPSPSPSVKPSASPVAEESPAEPGEILPTPLPENEPPDDLDLVPLDESLPPEPTPLESLFPEKLEPTQEEKDERRAAEKAEERRAAELASSLEETLSPYPDQLESAETGASPTPTPASYFRQPPPSIEITAAGRTPTQRTALNQALGSADVILGDLTGVRGTLTPPVLPQSRAVGRPTLRIGPFIFRPQVTGGVTVTNSSSGGGASSTEIGEYFQATVTAATARPGRWNGSMIYSIGVQPESGRSGASDSSGGIDQNLSLETSFSFEQISRIRFSAGFNFADLSGVSRDVGTETRRMLVTATLGASYSYSRKTSVDWDVILPIRDFEEGNSSEGLTTTIFVNNRITRKSAVGLGLTAGMLEVDGGGDQTFITPLLRFNSQPSRPLAFDATVGLEFRTADQGLSVNPTFGVGATWTPRPTTSVSLAADQRVVNSAAADNTNFTSTTFSLGVRQRLSHRLTGSLSLDYENADYASVGVGGQEGRSDQLFHATSGLSLELGSRWQVGLTLSMSNNESNDASFQFRFYQAALQGSFTF